MPARPRGRAAGQLPAAGQPSPDGEDTFVVLEHHDLRGTGGQVRWELRLERDGVPRSWTLPGEPPTGPDPADHQPLEQTDTLPGDGEVSRWDSGRYVAETEGEDAVTVTFAGRRLTGRYGLHRRDDGSWQLRRLDASPAPGPTAAPLPMLATTGVLPPPEDDDRWGYEFKWDGVRAVAAVHDGALVLTSRRGTVITARYPEVARLPEALTGHDAVLDGEIVLMDADGRPDFGALQNRMHRTGPEVPRMAAARPVTFLVFDLLVLDGQDLMPRPYAERRARLDALAPTGHRWVATPWFSGGGAGVLAASQENGLEGVVAKRLDSTYRPGVRSPDWRKLKNVRTQAVVVGGWRPGQGRRSGGIGSLLVGVPDDEGRLVYAGHVGTGFSAADLRTLQAGLTPRQTAPFEGTLPREVTRDAHWVEPDLVGEVAFAVWTADRRLRHPSWKGVRDDLEPDDVVVEP